MSRGPALWIRRHAPSVMPTRRLITLDDRAQPTSGLWMALLGFACMLGGLACSAWASLRQWAGAAEASWARAHLGCTAAVRRLRLW